MEASASQQLDKAHRPERCAELVMDGRSLLIAHIHIHFVEPIVNVCMGAGRGQAMGTLGLGEDEWPVFCLDGDFSILRNVPATRRSCVLLNSEHGGVGVLCDEVRVVDKATLTLVAVPGCMSSNHKLMDSLAIIDGKVACMLGVDRLSLMLHSDECEQARVPSGMP